MTDGESAGTTTRRSYGAYVLPGDPTWLDRTLPRYYPMLDDLVVPVPTDGLGWAGTPIPVDRCLEIVRRIDTRGLLRVVEGTWVHPDDPMRGETAQRQAALDALSPHVDWVVQLDGDELVPDPAALLAGVEHAERMRCEAVELPMRVLFRVARGRTLQVTTRDGRPHHEYPGPVVVRSGTRLTEARRTAGRFVRLTVDGDRSLQVARPAQAEEVRVGGLAPKDAIVHNSWAREPREIRAKLRGWGHTNDASFARYFWTVWWPAPVTWRLLRDFHPFARGLWPRLARAADA